MECITISSDDDKEPPPIKRPTVEQRKPTLSRPPPIRPSASARERKQKKETKRKKSKKEDKYSDDQSSDGNYDYNDNEDCDDDYKQEDSEDSEEREGSEESEESEDSEDNENRIERRRGREKKYRESSRKRKYHLSDAESESSEREDDEQEPGHKSNRIILSDDDELSTSTSQSQDTISQRRKRVRLGPTTRHSPVPSLSSVNSPFRTPSPSSSYSSLPSSQASQVIKEEEKEHEVDKGQTKEKEIEKEQEDNVEELIEEEEPPSMSSGNSISDNNPNARALEKAHAAAHIMKQSIPSASLPTELKRLFTRLDFRLRFALEMYLSVYRHKDKEDRWLDIKNLIKKLLDCQPDTTESNDRDLTQAHNLLLKHAAKQRFGDLVDRPNVGIKMREAKHDEKTVIENVDLHLWDQSIKAGDLSLVCQLSYRETKQKCPDIHQLAANSFIAFLGPFRDSSSRVSRKWGAHRLLRIHVDLPQQKGCLDRAINAYREIFMLGIDVAGRHYEFLTCTTSQLREGKCYFFATKGHDISSVTIEEANKWLGDFSGVKSLSKYLARMGQNFSTTVPTIPVPRSGWQLVDDITNGKYVFTDGCGELSSDMMAKVAKSLNLAEVPSAIQVRIGGLKGVLAVNPRLEPETMRYPRSMEKFVVQEDIEEHAVLEVIKVSNVLPGHLNRQYIRVLHCLGVPDEYFIKKQDEYIEEIFNFNLSEEKLRYMHQLVHSEESLHPTESLVGTSTPRALPKGRKYRLINSMILEIIAMLAAGHDMKEPYLHGLLLSTRRGLLERVITKTRIPIKEAVVLLGVWDQTRTLNYGQCYVNINNMPLKGLVAVSKTPCVHPGDFRLLEAVDVPGLGHLTNVIVFPVQGERPHANEIGGGDLDGDQFFVSWCKEITSSMQMYSPHAYNATEQVAPCAQVYAELHQQLINQFLKQIQSESIGTIAIAHAVICSKFPTGAKHDFALELAELHSRAVDAAKTGDIVIIPKHIAFYTNERPYYMAKKGQQGFISSCIVGRLYDVALAASKKIDVEERHGTVKLDVDLVLHGNEDYREMAAEELKKYNRAVTRVLKRTQDQTIARVQIEELANDFRHRFHILLNKRGDPEEITWMTQNSPELLNKASAYYEVTYQTRRQKKGSPEDQKVSAGLSFPWKVCGGYLNKIKAQRITFSADDKAQPISIAVRPDLRRATIRDQTHKFY